LSVVPLFCCSVGSFSCSPLFFAYRPATFFVPWRFPSRSSLARLKASLSARLPPIVFQKRELLRPLPGCIVSVVLLQSVMRWGLTAPHWSDFVVVRLSIPVEGNAATLFQTYWWECPSRRGDSPDISFAFLVQRAVIAAE